MDISMYKPTDLELWINREYQKNGIHYALDIDIEYIASIFNLSIRSTFEETRAIWDDEFGVILLNAYYKEDQKRQSFFHELGHCLRHVGCQHRLPVQFMKLQETQASLFQLYAAMPIFMIEEFINDVYSWAAFEKTLSEAFCLPIRFVQKRLEQIKNRIYWAQKEKDRRERVVDTSYITDEYIQKLKAELGRRRFMEASNL